MPNQDERLLAALIYVISFFTVFLGPLLIWLFKKDSSSYIDYHGKEYFNFLFSYIIYGIVGYILLFVLVGFILLPLIALCAFIFTIVGAIKAYEGDQYRIPFIFRIL